jgi:hypothetical protein
VIITGKVLLLNPKKSGTHESLGDSASFITEAPQFLLEKSLSNTPHDSEGLSGKNFSKKNSNTLTKINTGSLLRKASIRITASLNEKKSLAENMEENYWNGNFLSPKKKRTHLIEKKSFTTAASAAYTLNKHNSDGNSVQRGLSTFKTREGEDLLNLDDVESIIQALPMFKVSKTLEVGDGFGESVLLTNSRRDCLALCKEDTNLLYISKTAYDKIMGEFNSKMIAKKIAFLKNYTIFKGLNENRIYNIFEKMKKLDMKLNDTIFKEGDKSDKIYFIKKGEVEVSRRIGA